MHAHDFGLAHDLDRIAASMQQRRRVLRWIAGSSALTLLGCGGGGTGETSEAASATTGTTATTGTAASTAATTAGTAATTTSPSAAANSSGQCAVVPEETAGPYPADGSNSSSTGLANALMLSGIVRGDIRSSIAGATGVAEGVPLTVRIRLVDVNDGCDDLSGYAIYLWHCDRDGRYSMYSAGVTGENYLRGVQQTDVGGTVTFTTIFPGCYDGRMPHMHFEVFRSLTAATSAMSKLKTSQIAFPTDVCTTVYHTAPGYSASLSNLQRIGFATDNVFRDGVSLQLASVTGNVTQGYVATLTVGIAA